jgi:hypothetical protein
MVALAVSERAESAAAEQQLIPIDPGLQALGHLGPPLIAVRQSLLGERPPGVSAVVYPSFDKEWAVQVAYDRGEPFVLLAIMDRPFWGALQELVHADSLSEVEALRRVKIPVTRRTAPLQGATARVLERAWMHMISAATMPAEHRRIIDGVTYVFFAAIDGKESAALTHSPEARTPAVALTYVVQALRGHALADAAARAETERVVTREADALLQQLGRGR